VLRNDCKPFVPIKACTAGLEPIDASELASFVPPASGERISVRGVLGLDSPSSTFAACHQTAPGITDCCNMASAEVFVGALPNGVRLDRLACYGDDSRLCCPVPAFGQVVVQGLARGRVVVAADSGGPGEVITSGHDGLLYRTGDQDDLTRTLERVAAAGPQLAAIRWNAVDTAQDYHPKRTAERLQRALDRVVDRPSVR